MIFAIKVLRIDGFMCRCIKKNVKVSAQRRDSHGSTAASLYPCVNCKCTIKSSTDSPTKLSSNISIGKTLVDYQHYSNHIRECNRKQHQFNAGQAMEQMMAAASMQSMYIREQPVAFISPQQTFYNEQQFPEQTSSQSDYAPPPQAPARKKKTKPANRLPPPPAADPEPMFTPDDYEQANNYYQQYEEDQSPMVEPAVAMSGATAAAAAVDDRVQCSICERKFNSDAMERHRKACEKLNSRPRKVFDSAKTRAQGTALEAYQRNRSYLKTMDKKQQRHTKHRDPV